MKQLHLGQMTETDIERIDRAIMGLSYKTGKKLTRRDVFLEAIERIESEILDIDAEAFEKSKQTEKQERPQYFDAYGNKISPLIIASMKKEGLDYTKKSDCDTWGRGE